jgi:hypothetical protein
MNLLLLAILFVPVSLSAQIKLAEPKPVKSENPDWWHLKDIVYAPYDSSYLEIRVYPALDAYEKYIGQQLYLPSNDKLKSLLYSDKFHIETWHHPDTSYIWHPAKTRVNSSDPLLVTNKYYDIIGVLSVAGNEFLKHKHEILDYDRDHGSYEDKEGLKYIFIDPKDIPYFVLKETESGDTVYTAYPRRFILVGGFVKLRQKHIGENIFEISEKPGDHNINKNLIKDRWKCTDLVLSTERSPKNIDRDGLNRSSANPLVSVKLASMDVYIDLTLQNTEDSTKEKEIDLRAIEESHSHWMSETAFNEEWDKVFAKLAAEEKERKEKEEKAAKEDAKTLAELQKFAEQREAERRQQLSQKYDAATVNKILAGKFEIGMSKAVCREIGGYIKVIEKTATAETWQVSNLWTGNSIYLQFLGDKLVRIVNP